MVIAVSKQGVIDFLGGASLEVTPGGASKIDSFSKILRAGSLVYVTFLPGSDFGDTIEVSHRLKSEGMVPIPHFAARSVPSASFLRENLGLLQERVGVKEALLIGGAVDVPVGDFSSSIELMQTGLFQEFGIHRLGIAGHPEGSPDISDTDILSALSAKVSYGRSNGLDLYIATQFCFEAEPIISWERNLRELGYDIPIHIGLPGLASIKALLRHAQACGVGASMQFLKKRAMDVAKLLVVSAPDRLVCDLVHYLDNEKDSLIHRVHLYPLGGLAKSTDWLYAVLDGSFEFNNRGGFRI